MLRFCNPAGGYAHAIVRSTPEQDARLRARLAEAVRVFASGSADRFGQMIGYTNRGYIREIIGKKGKPVREQIIARVHATSGMEGWFTGYLNPVSAADAGLTVSRAAQEVARLYDRLPADKRVLIDALVHALQAPEASAQPAAPWPEPTRRPAASRRTRA